MLLIKRCYWSISVLVLLYIVAHSSSIGLQCFDTILSTPTSNQCTCTYAHVLYDVYDVYCESNAVVYKQLCVQCRGRHVALIDATGILTESIPWWLYQFEAILNQFMKSNFIYFRIVWIYYDSFSVLTKVQHLLTGIVKVSWSIIKLVKAILL